MSIRACWFTVLAIVVVSGFGLVACSRGVQIEPIPVYTQPYGVAVVCPAGMRLAGHADSIIAEDRGPWLERVVVVCTAKR